MNFVFHPAAMADSNSGTPNSFNFSHCKNNNQRPRISIHHIEIQPEDISIHLAFNVDSGHQTSFMVCDRV
ncbi:hypothetical protein AAZX31_03G051800 [Glycine max]